MLISKKVTAAINQQIGNEFSAYVQYLSIATHFEGEALPQLARHFYGQADEERGHAMRFIKYLVDTGSDLAIPAIEAPRAKFSKAEEAVKLSLERETDVTKQINSLVHLAKAESDYTTDNFLQWFIREQLEEVSSMDHLLKIIQRAGESGLLRVEEYLARKTSGKAASPPEAV